MGLPHDETNFGIGTLAIWLSMILSENRFPLFGIMLDPISPVKMAFPAPLTSEQRAQANIAQFRGAAGLDAVIVRASG
jgi:hypothetical protein